MKFTVCITRQISGLHTIRDANVTLISEVRTAAIFILLMVGTERYKGRAGSNGMMLIQSVTKICQCVKNHYVRRYHKTILLMK